MAEDGEKSGIPEGGLNNRGAVFSFLEERSKFQSEIIASRILARILPCFIQCLERELPLDKTLLPILRALAAGRFFSYWPNSELIEYHQYQLIAASAKEHVEWLKKGKPTRLNDPLTVAYRMLQISFSVANIPALTNTQAALAAADVADFADAAVAAYAQDKKSYSVFASWFWGQLTDDCAILQHEGAASFLARQLWFPNPWIRSAESISVWLSNDWSEFKNQLSKLQTEDWGVWVDWYDDILNGRPGPIYNQDIELARLFGLPDEGLEITEEDWKAGPSVVNPKIRQVLDWFEKNPPFTEVQVPSVSTNNLIAIRLNAEQLRSQVAHDLESHIASKPNDPDQLQDWQDQQSLLESISEKLEQLVSVIDGSDLTTNHVDQVEGVLAELGREFESWIITNKPELVDAVIRLPIAAGLIGLLNSVGANMPVATTAVLAYVGGDKMVKLYKQMTGKSEDKE